MELDYIPEWDLGGTKMKGEPLQTRWQNGLVMASIVGPFFSEERDWKYKGPT